MIKRLNYDEIRGIIAHTFVDRKYKYDDLCEKL